MKVKWILIVLAVCGLALVLTSVDFDWQSVGKSWFSIPIIAGLAAVILIVLLVILSKKGVLKVGQSTSKLLMVILFLAIFIGFLTAVIKPDRLLMMAREETVIFFVCLAFLVIGIGFWKLSNKKYPAWFALIGFLLLLPVGLVRSNPDRLPAFEELPIAGDIEPDHELVEITDPQRLAEMPRAIRGYDVVVTFREDGVALEIPFEEEDNGKVCFIHLPKGLWSCGRGVYGVEGENSGYGDYSLCSDWPERPAAGLAWIGTPYPCDNQRRGWIRKRINPGVQPLNRREALLKKDGTSFYIDFYEWMAEGELEWPVLCLNGNESLVGYGDGNRGYVMGQVWILEPKSGNPILEAAQAAT